MPLDLMPYFVGYRWPGNIRELENINEISLADLPPQIAADLPSTGISLENVEKEKHGLARTIEG